MPERTLRGAARDRATEADGAEEEEAEEPMNTMPEHAWVFPAKLERVIDGDTIICTLDIGFSTYRVDHLRLLGVNAPEARGATKVAGDAATAFVREWLALAVGDWPLLVETHKSDVFGRYLALAYRVIGRACLNDDLITAGHAVPFMG
jgi:endonuclease YncB( thermonuclease family)